jgi:hypothetical protein
VLAAPRAAWPAARAEEHTSPSTLRRISTARLAVARVRRATPSAAAVNMNAVSGSIAGYRSKYFQVPETIEWKK